MAESLDSIKLTAELSATLKNTIDGEVASVGQGFKFSPKVVSAADLANGTGANQADRIWQDKARSLTGATNEDIDVFDFGAIDIGGGAGKDGLGQAMALVEIVAIMIYNHATSVGTMVVGGNGTAAAWNAPFNGSDTAQIGPFKPGGMCLLFNPGDPAWAVADVSNHLLRITSSADITYSPFIIGRSA